MNRGVSFALTILLGAGSAVAETAEEKGVAIALAAERADEGFQSTTAAGRMILRDRKGRESVRDFRVKVLEVLDDGDKTLIVFDRPQDIKRTALLTIGHKDRDDDQWLYLPALKRVKRITSNSQSGAFVGSEFSYEDLTSQEVEKYTYKWLRDEPCPGVSELICHVNERYPKSKESGYSRQVIWLDREEYRIFRVDYYDRKKAHLKTLVVEDHRLYEDRFWRPDRMLMSNHQNGKSTLLMWSEYDFGAELGDGEFTQRALERAR